VLVIEIEVHGGKLAVTSTIGRDLPRKFRLSAEFFNRVLRDSVRRADYLEAMHAARENRAVSHTVETLAAEIGRIVTERQELRAAGAAPAELEENRRRLAAAQSALSRLLIERHLPSTDVG
jgi:hypothetical protein